MHNLLQLLSDDPMDCWRRSHGVGYGACRISHQFQRRCAMRESERPPGYRRSRYEGDRQESLHIIITIITETETVPYLQQAIRGETITLSVGSETTKLPDVYRGQRRRFQALPDG